MAASQKTAPMNLAPQIAQEPIIDAENEIAERLHLAQRPAQKYWH